MKGTKKWGQVSTHSMSTSWSKAFSVRNRRLPAMILAGLLCLALLAGCGVSKPAADGGSSPAGGGATEGNNSAPAGNGETQDVANTEKIVINFAAQADDTPGTQQIIDKFNASQDRYEVKWVEMTNDSGQMHDQLLTSLASGSGEYDIVSLDVVWAGEFASAGYIEAIDEMLRGAGLSKADFNSGSIASGTYMGKLYTLPFFPDLGLLYFRSDIVSADDAAKLVSGDYNYNDLADMAQKYAGQGGTSIGYVYQSAQYEGLVCNSTEFTASFTDIKGGLETMKRYTDASFTPSDILNYNEGATHTAFINGTSVFARNWPYQYGIILGGGEDVNITVEQTGVAPLPNGGSVGGWLLAMNKGSANKDGAWEFMKFVAGTEGQMISATAGGKLPGLNALLDDSTVKAQNPMLEFEGFKNAVSTTIARPIVTEYTKVSDAIQIQIHSYLSGSQDIDTTVKGVEDAIK